MVGSPSTNRQTSRSGSQTNRNNTTDAASCSASANQPAGATTWRARSAGDRQWSNLDHCRFGTRLTPGTRESRRQDSRRPTQRVGSSNQHHATSGGSKKAAHRHSSTIRDGSEQPHTNGNSGPNQKVY